MNYNTQNAKIASITEKTLIVGIDVGSETHYARAFDWRKVKRGFKTKSEATEWEHHSCNSH
jgi:hypothetical protein